VIFRDHEFIPTTGGRLDTDSTLMLWKAKTVAKTGPAGGVGGLARRAHRLFSLLCDSNKKLKKHKHKSSYKILKKI